jgi:hypothetical protein
MRSMQDRSRWSEPTSDDEAHARAAGRRRHNALRRFRAQLRRVQVLNLAGELGGFHPGVQAQIARLLGVSEATISRDVAAILSGPDPRDAGRCPFCGCRGHVVDGQVEPFDPDGLLPDPYLAGLLDTLDR